MLKKNNVVCLYTILHLMVDFATVFLIAGVLLGPVVGVVKRAEIIIVYNIVAFAGQLPLGILADVINKNRQLVALGCICAALAYPFVFVSPWLACVVAATGNGLFHVGAGTDILKMSMPKAGLPGLFVSSGAFGVWLAYKACGGFVMYICPLVMFIAFLFVMWSSKKQAETAEGAEITYSRRDVLALLPVACFMMTIVIRSFLGMIMNYSWKAVPVLSLVFVMAVVGGKACGGYLADRFGHVKTALISLAISLVLFVFSFDLWLAGVIAVFCFNMTMPLTLVAIAGVSDGKYGLSFGLTTFALAAGFVPVVFGAQKLFSVPTLVTGVLLSVLFMVAGYILLKKIK